jgi:O-antigen ligase
MARIVAPRMLLLSAALLVLAFIASNHYPPWSASHSDLLAACSALALLFGVAWAGRASEIGVPRAALAIFGLALVPLIQYAAGIIFFLGDAWIASLYLVGAGASVLASSAASRTNGVQWPRVLATTLLIGALLNCAIAWMQRFDAIPSVLALHVLAVRPGSGPIGNVAQPNQLTSLLALGLAGLWWLYEQGRMPRRWAIALALLLASTMAMTQSRTGLLQMGLALAAVFFVRRRLSLRTSASFVALLCLWWMLSFAAWPAMVESLGHGHAVDPAQRLAGGPRPLMWGQLVEALSLQPWTGYGWGQVSVAQTAVAANYPDSRFTEHAHNLVLDLLVWNGVPLGLLIIAAATIWLVARIRRNRSLEGSFGLLLIGFLLAHAMVEYPLDYLYFLVPFGLAIGLVEAQQEEHLMVKGSVVCGAGVLALALTAWAATDYWDVEAAYRRMRLTNARIGSPGSNEAPPEISTQFTQLGAFYRYSLLQPRADMRPEELAWARKVVARFGYAPAIYKLVLCEAINGDLSGAEQDLRRLKNLHRKASYDEAREELEQLGRSDYPVLRQLRIP